MFYEGDVLVATFDEFAAAHNAPRFGGDVALQRGMGSLPGAAWRRLWEAEMERIDANYHKRQDLRAVYAQLCAAGVIRPPTRLERAAQTATGHPDNESVQAARRLLSKMGALDGLQFTLIPDPERHGAAAYNSFRSVW